MTQKEVIEKLGNDMIDKLFSNEDNFDINFKPIGKFPKSITTDVLCSKLTNYVKRKTGIELNLKEYVDIAANNEIQMNISFLHCLIRKYASLCSVIEIDEYGMSELAKYRKELDGGSTRILFKTYGEFHIKHIGLLKKLIENDLSCIGEFAIIPIFDQNKNIKIKTDLFELFLFGNYQVGEF